MKKLIRIGTRESLLACAQAELLEQYIRNHHPEYEVVLVKIKTTGDRILDRNLAEIGGKGLFVRELDQALYENRTDLSVHSLKDLPMEVSADFPVLGYSRREDPRDVLVLPQGCTKMNPDQPFGTSSPRRQIQLRQLYPDCQIRPVRGNVLTRLQKLDHGEYGALVLAAAGLCRIGLTHRISGWYPVEQMVPAAGQGILAVQGRKDFDRSILEGFFDSGAGWQAVAERSFVSAFGGGCSSPVAACAAILGEQIHLTGMLAGKDNGVQKAHITAPKQEAEQAGKRLAEMMGNSQKQGL